MRQHEAPRPGASVQHWRSDYIEAESESWSRADPARALIERTQLHTYRVCLSDGADTHVVQLWTYRGAYIGRCDCEGYEYHSRCAHLATIRKAEYVGATDTHGRRVDVEAVEEREPLTDGGHDEMPWSDPNEMDSSHADRL